MYFALLCCAVVDLTLSYNYYLSDSEIFVNTESNVEFVNFLTDGVFPAHTFIKFIIALPLLLFIFSWFDVLHDSIRGNTMFYIERFRENIHDHNTELVLCIVLLLRIHMVHEFKISL